MGSFSLIAVVLLTLVGYSSGNVLGARRKKVAPGLADLVLVLALWSAAVVIHGQLGKWGGIGAGFGLGLLVGLPAGVLRPGKTDGREKFAYLEDGEPAAETGFLAAWKRFAMEMGNFQGRMIMAFFYFGIVTPFALISRLGSEGGGKRAGERSFWRERELTPLQLDQARNQF